jgi:hypothetical protein
MQPLTHGVRTARSTQSCGQTARRPSNVSTVSTDTRGDGLSSDSIRHPRRFHPAHNLSRAKARPISIFAHAHARACGGCSLTRARVWRTNPTHPRGTGPINHLTFRFRRSSLRSEREVDTLLCEAGFGLTALLILSLLSISQVKAAILADPNAPDTIVEGATFEQTARTTSPPPKS